MTRTPHSASSLFYSIRAKEDKSTLFKNAVFRLRIRFFSWVRPSGRLVIAFSLRKNCGILWSRLGSGRRFLRFSRRWVSQGSTFSSFFVIITSQLSSFLPLRPSSFFPSTVTCSSLLLPQPSCRPDSVGGFSSFRSPFGWDLPLLILTLNTEGRGILRCNCDTWPIHFHLAWRGCDFRVPSDWAVPLLPFSDLFHCQSRLLLRRYSILMRLFEELPCFPRQQWVHCYQPRSKSKRN